MHHDGYSQWKAIGGDESRGTSGGFEGGGGRRLLRVQIELRAKPGESVPKLAAGILSGR
jgi:hypothetical protein